MVLPGRVPAELHALGRVYPATDGTQPWMPAALKRFLEEPRTAAVAERLYRDDPEHLANVKKIADGSMNLLRGSDSTLIGTWALNNAAQSVTLGNAYTGGSLQFATGGGDRLIVTSAAMTPAVDGAMNLGSASLKFANVYATNGQIQTSDRTLKDNIRPFSDVEKRVAARLRDLLRIWQWKDAIAEKGVDHARLHSGWIAQDVHDAFVAEGLDPSRYALWCSDPVTEERARVTGKGTRPLMDTVEVEETQTVVENGRALRKTVTVSREVPRTVALPVFDEAGAPVMERVQDGWLVEPKPLGDRQRQEPPDEGVPNMVERQVIHHEPVTEEFDLTETVREPTGEVRLGLRLSETLAFVLAAGA